MNLYLEELTQLAVEALITVVCLITWSVKRVIETTHTPSSHHSLLQAKEVVTSAASVVKPPSMASYLGGIPALHGKAVLKL